MNTYIEYKAFKNLYIYRKVKGGNSPFSFSGYLWSYWDDEEIPEIVQKCIKNWKEIGLCTNIKFLNKKTVLDWIPETNMHIYISITHNIANRSDLIRLYLLYTYGGIWVDASVFFTRALKSWLNTDNDEVFCYQAERFSSKKFICLETFFIKSIIKKNKFIKDWLDMCINYFKLSSEEFTKVNKKYIQEFNGDYYYLKAYIANMKLLYENKYDNIIYESAETGPYVDTIKHNWNSEKICQNITYDQNMIKLYSGTRNTCDSGIVKLSTDWEY